MITKVYEYARTDKFVIQSTNVIPSTVRTRESYLARPKLLPSPTDYQPAPEATNRVKVGTTTFGASARPVLSPTNHTVQGSVAGGFASHRRVLSPRPGPGTHSPSLGIIDHHGRSIWVNGGNRSPSNMEADRLKSKIHSLNVRLSGDVSTFETMTQERLKQVR